MELGPLDLAKHFPAVSTATWQRKMLRDVSDPDRLVWSTLEGIRVRALYRAKDAPHAAPRPGGSRYIREDVRVTSPGEANQLAQEALRGGSTSVGFVMRCAPSERGLREMCRGIDATVIPLHFECSSEHARTLTTWLQVARSPQSLKGSVSLDPAARGGGGYAELVDLCKTADGSNLRTIRIDTEPYHMAGAGPALEMACALGITSDVLARLTASGLDARIIARRIHFVIPVASSYFMAIAKLRALRHLARLVFEAYGAIGVQPVIDAVTSVRSQSWLDAEINLVRATTQAMAAVIGCCDSLRVKPSGTGPDAVRLARSLQLLLRCEAHLDDVADPAAGSYFVEVLTDKLGRAAWTRFQAIEADGGFSHARRKNSLKRDFDTTRRARRENLATGRRLMIGVNSVPDLNANPTQESATGRDAEDFEALRLRSRAIAHRLGRRPSALIVPSPERSTHTDLARRALRSAGFTLVEGSPGNTTTDVVAVCLPCPKQWTKHDGEGTKHAILVSVGGRSLEADHALYPGKSMLPVLHRILDDLDAT